MGSVIALIPGCRDERLNISGPRFVVFREFGVVGDEILPFCYIGIILYTIMRISFNQPVEWKVRMFFLWLRWVLPHPKLTANAPENRQRAPKGKVCLPTIHVQVLC